MIEAIVHGERHSRVKLGTKHLILGGTKFVRAAKTYQFLEEMKGLRSVRSSTSEDRRSVKPQGLHLTKPLHIFSDRALRL